VPERPTDIDNTDDDDEDRQPSPLGAAATLPAGPGGTTPRDAGGPPRGRRSRLPIRTGALLVLLAVVLLAAVPAFASGLKKTPRNRIGISYGGGPIEGSHFQRVVKPGHALFFNGFYDPLYTYPVDQQSYIVSKVPGQGSVKGVDFIVAPTKDRVQVQYQLAVYFKLNTDRLRQFHEQLGLRYRAYTSAGWANLISNTFRQQIENALQQETRRYDVADIYSNEALLKQLQSNVQTTISQRLKLALGDNYFCGPTFQPGGTCSEVTFIIKKIDLPKSVVAAFEAQRGAQISIGTRQAEAQAIEALNAALKEAGQNYVLIKAIESGKINFWVLPSDSGGLTLTTPNSGSSAPTPSTTSTTAPKSGP
jgi:regulator of protease activity HflC (stomatin/prohibitin superfamily)